MEIIDTIELCKLMIHVKSIMNKYEAAIRDHVAAEKLPTTSDTYTFFMQKYATAAVLYQKLYRLYHHCRAFEWKIEPTERGRY